MTITAALSAKQTAINNILQRQAIRQQETAATQQQPVLRHSSAEPELLLLDLHTHNSRRRLNPKFSTLQHHELKRVVRLYAVDKNTREEAKHMPRSLSDNETPRHNITNQQSRPAPTTPIHPVLNHDNSQTEISRRFKYSPLVLWGGDNKEYRFNWSEVKRQQLPELQALLLLAFKFNHQQIAAIITDIQQYQDAKVRFGQRRDILMDEAMPCFQQAIAVYS